MIQPHDTIKTERIALSIIGADDAPDIFETLNNAQVTGPLSVFTWPMTMEQATRWAAQSTDGFQTKQEFMFIARHNKDRKNIGCLGIHLSRSNDTDAETGYWVAANAQGQGFATEMLNAAITFAREHLMLETIYATAAMDNAASAHVLRKCGFVFSKNIKLDLPNGSLRPSKLFRLSL